MASNPESAPAVAIPAASNDADGVADVSADTAGALDTESLDAYHGDEQDQADKKSQDDTEDVDMNISGDASNYVHDDENDSALSSPTSSLSSPDEALLETTPLHLSGAEDAPTSLPASSASPDDTSMVHNAAADAAPAAAADTAAVDVDADADAAAALPMHPAASLVVPPELSGESAPAEADAAADVAADADTGAPAASGNPDPGTADAPASTAENAPDFASVLAAISAAAEPSSVQAEAKAESPAKDAETVAQGEPGSIEQGIDIDKMLDAISADAPPPTASRPSTIQPGQSAGGPSAAPLTTDESLPFYYATTGAPGTVGSTTVLGSPPSSVTGPNGSATAPGTSQPSAASRRGNNNNSNKAAKAAVDRAYEEFLLEERRYMADPDWEKFPEGSRMFIGNLSQERVSKRDVFEAFHRFGRLAQISIKSAYGFVQYHKASEAQEAMQNLQGIEIRGRKIHLELSRPQKKEKERERSAERGKGRGGRGADRYDGREHGRRRGRDDYRPDIKDGRDSSPRRERGDRDRDDHYGRDRGGRNGSGKQGRDRSRSPNRSGTNGRGYRSRRSPSPYGRHRNDHGGTSDNFPSRHGSDVPDVQFLVTQGVERDFIKWVQAAFTERGLKTDIMFMTPHSPSRDSVIQTHVLEGVAAVVDLTVNAQASLKIPLQVFDRTAGTRNVRFDGYQDLTPQVAADVVVRAKAAANPYQGAGGYGQQPYGAPAPGPQGYASNYQAPPVAAPQAAAAAQPGAYDLAALMGQLDGAALSQLLAALQAPQAGPAYPQQGVQYGQSAAPQMNIGALLSTLGASAGGSAQPAPAAYGGSAPYGSSVPSGTSTSYMPATQNPNDQSLQAIMAQLAQYKK